MQQYNNTAIEQLCIVKEKEKDNQRVLASLAHN